MRGTWDFLPDALDIVAPIENPNRRVDVVEIYNQGRNLRRAILLRLD
jgi:hypothetical protein